MPPSYRWGNKTVLRPRLFVPVSKGERDFLPSERGQLSAHGARRGGTARLWRITVGLDSGAEERTEHVP